jgi:hypothetical protein
MATPGLFLALQGCGAGLPSGVVVNHAVGVLTTGADRVWVFDPTRANRSRPVAGSATKILGWCGRLRGAEFRVVTEGEFSMLAVNQAKIGTPGLLAIDQEPDTRLLRLKDGKFVIPATVTFRAVDGVFVIARNEPGYLVTQDGELCVVLAHNVASFTPKENA